MGEVQYREWRPAPVLEEYVACYWYYARRFGPAGVEQVLPDGFIELVVQIGAPYRHQGRPLPGVVVIGLLDESLRLEATGWVEQWCVRFRPWGVAPFGDLRRLGQRPWCAAGDVFSAGVVLAVSRAATGGDEVTQALEGALLSELLAWQGDDVTLRAAGHLLAERGGALTIEDLAAACERSRRQLERIFRTRIGRAPREVAARMRFEYARRLLVTTDLGVAEIAAEAGYADHSHLARAFATFARTTPGAHRTAFRSSVSGAGEGSVAFVQDPAATDRAQ